MNEPPGSGLARPLTLLGPLASCLPSLPSLQPSDFYLNRSNFTKSENQCLRK